MLKPKGPSPGLGSRAEREGRRPHGRTLRGKPARRRRSAGQDPPLSPRPVPARPPGAARGRFSWVTHLRGHRPGSRLLLPGSRGGKRRVPPVPRLSGRSEPPLRFPHARPPRWGDQGGNAGCATGGRLGFPARPPSKVRGATSAAGLNFKARPAGCSHPRGGSPGRGRESRLPAGVPPRAVRLPAGLQPPPPASSQAAGVRGGLRVP